MREVSCECGEAMGDECGWTGSIGETVVVRWMPPWLRASHEAAGGGMGQWPLDGSLRLRVERSCADRLLTAYDEDGRKVGRDPWCSIVEPEAERDLFSEAEAEEAALCAAERDLSAAGYDVTVADDGSIQGSVELADGDDDAEAAEALRRILSHVGPGDRHGVSWRIEWTGRYIGDAAVWSLTVGGR